LSNPVPGVGALDASSLAVHLDLGAEHAGWQFGWRDAPITDQSGRRYVETYCYAFAASDFLENEPEQLYWRTDIVQMTRYYMLEAARCGVRLSPRQAVFQSENVVRRTGHGCRVGCVGSRHRSTDNHPRGRGPVNRLRFTRIFRR
jgi:hypothetical protein